MSLWRCLDFIRKLETFNSLFCPGRHLQTVTATNLFARLNYILLLLPRFTISICYYYPGSSFPFAIITQVHHFHLLLLPRFIISICYYYPGSSELFDNLDRTGSTRSGDVVDAYVHALLGSFPRARYVVGMDAKFIFSPLIALPEWLSDWLLFKSQPNQPLPAALLRRKS
jgi:hypothetical protein